MINKKGLVVLVVVAVALIIVSIGLALSDSEDVSTQKENSIDTGAGKIGINIVPPTVEDKMEGEHGTN